jgi:hypothetical protein
MRITESGNIGIGTTSPASILHISGSGQTIMRLDSSTTTNISQFMVKANTDGVLVMGMSGGSAASTSFGVTAAGQAYIGTTTLSTVHPTSLVIGNVSTIPIIFSTNNTERMRITSGGNVGIGTTSINAKLDILQSSTSNNQIKIYSDDGTAQLRTYSTSDGYGLIINQYYAVVGSPYVRSADFVASTGDVSSTMMRFFTKDYSSNPAERVRITSDGNVGIGTSSPAYKLDVSGSANITGSLTAGRLLIGTVTSGTAAGDGVVKLGTYGHCISQNGAAVVSGSYVDLTVNTTGTGYQGFLTVANTQESNAAVRTQTTFSVFGRGASATFTTIATADGPTAGALFTVTTPSNGVIRITNTIGFPTSISVQFFGGTSF